MKKTRLRLFLLLEGALFLLNIFELIHNWDLLLVILFGAVLIMTNKKRVHRQNMLYWTGWFLIALSILSTFTIWLMLGLLLVYAVFNGGSILENFHFHAFDSFPWKKKNYVGVTVKEPAKHSGKRKKQKWVGGTHVGEHVYEWDDMNISVFMGDSIIDLGNTLLPNKENVVLIRKGIGQTRVIVPKGVGVSLQHSALQGKVIFNQEPYPLQNETLTLYSSDYDTATRTIKLVSNTLLGDFEVIYL
ncbi:cell wall-active antibiotics response protein LiaF [Jeotgalibaca caeni]|uniref:cell wall-active antibiotics response protein LiaF n=1 Tax=Jeotgalibaca caeni TaxID=3028623 RepID=UPI00237D8545|nr:cell wall-active antibiotics response protein LiaF [Jeotgalibaca caeni]MDE1548408.1 cell wall-active antibiotics response protein LiaF [Jeotgalibaca caeni]